VPIPEAVQNIPGRLSIATKEIVFRAKDIPALGLSFYLAGKIHENIFELPRSMTNFISNEVNIYTYVQHNY